MPTITIIGPGAIGGTDADAGVLRVVAIDPSALLAVRVYLT